jgi:RNA polymerase sigma-70 factor (ECF subfamily)
MLPLFLTIENNNERQTVEQIWERHKERMYKIAEKVLTNNAEIEDAVMDAVHNVVRNAKKFVDLSESDTVCLITIYVKHAALKIYNQNKKDILNKTDNDALHNVSENISVEEIVITKDKYQALSKEIQNMPEKYSYPFLLRYYYQFSFKDIALALGLSEDAVKKRTYRAKQKLLTFMEEDDDE